MGFMWGWHWMKHFWISSQVELLNSFITAAYLSRQISGDVLAVEARNDGRISLQKHIQLPETH